MTIIEKYPFPRGKELPPQSPLYWVHHKDRYLRQLLIQDIEVETKRELVVYFTDCSTNAQIDFSDDIYLIELLGSLNKKEVDLLLETNGGYTDATEKVVSILKPFSKNLRVIIPRRAKSNGTVIALSGKSILVGPNSELGPIDPFITLGPGQLVPADFILKSSNVDPIVNQVAKSAMNQTKKLATSVLKEGMLKDKNKDEINKIVDKISSRDHYHSHGSVIDADEAKGLGLNIEFLSEDDQLWKKIWLLRTMCEYDCKAGKISKLFESRKISSSVSL